MTVSGRVERFRDELQVELKAIRRAEEEAPDPAEFLPVAYRDMEELDGFLEHLAREVYDPDLRALLDSFLGDDGVPRRASAARPARAPATTPTSAGCSSTPWRSRRSRSRPASSTRGSTRTCS